MKLHSWDQQPTDNKFNDTDEDNFMDFDDNEDFYKENDNVLIVQEDNESVF